MDSLSKLKAHREAIANCLENLKQCDDPSEKSRLLQILQDEKEKYKNERCRDHRVYTSNVSTWKDSFNIFLELKEYCNPQRGVNMAVDVLLPYEEIKGSPLELDDLVCGKKLRRLLEEF